jgi:hypothetical protein
VQMRFQPDEVEPGAFGGAASTCPKSGPEANGACSGRLGRGQAPRPMRPHGGPPRRRSDRSRMGRSSSQDAVVSASRTRPCSADHVRHGIGSRPRSRASNDAKVAHEGVMGGEQHADVGRGPGEDDRRGAQVSEQELESRRVEGRVLGLQDKVVLRIRTEGPRDALVSHRLLKQRASNLRKSDRLRPKLSLT